MPGPVGPAQYTPSVTYVNQPPSTPTATGATNVQEEQADLNGDAYSDPDGDPHASTDWQVRQQGDADWSNPVFESLQDTTNLETITATGLPEDTGLEYRLRYRDDQGNVSAWSNISQFTTSSVAPSLTNPTGTATGDTTADGSVDTDEDDGTLYWVVTESSTSPSVAQIQSGQNANGDPAAASGNQSVSSTGTQNVSASGLDAGTQYWFHFQQQDEVGNDSTVVTSSSFTTDAVEVVDVDAGHLEVWSDLEAAGGTREAVLTPTSAQTTVNLKGEDKLTLEHPRDLDAWDEVDVEDIIRLVRPDGTVEEWRIRKPIERRKTSGALVAKVTAEPVLLDLTANAEVIERVEADGLARGRFDLQGRTPSDHWDAAIGAAAPSYFNKGTFEPTEEVDLEYDWSTPLAALRQLAEITGAELEAERQSDGSYNINLLNERGSAAPTVHVHEAKNLRGLKDETDSREQATRVYPIGGGRDAPVTMADHRWEVESVSGSDVILVGDPVAFDAQLDGLYVEKANGNLTEITATTAPDTLTVADATNITAGDLLTVRRNASGDELTWLEDPVSKGTYGLKSKVLRKDEVPPIQQLVTDPFVREWSGGSPVNYDLVGSPPVEQSTADDNTQLGGSSARIGNGTTKAAKGEGIETDIISVSPTAADPFLAVTASLRLVSGSVVLTLVDVTNGEELPDPAGTNAVVFDSAGRWAELLGIDSPDNFFERGTSQVRVRVVADEDGTEFYFDAAQLAPRAEAPDTFVEDRASNRLWRAANEELEASAQPKDKFTVDVLDLERLLPDVFDPDELVLGGTVRVIDRDLGLDFTSRIIEIQRNELKEGATQITISNRPEDLTGFLGRPAPAGRRSRRRSGGLPVPGDIDQSTIQWTFTDRVELDWNAAEKAEDYVLRWAATDVGWASANDLGTAKGDTFLVPRERIVNEIAGRSFWVYIRARNGDRLSRNIAKVQVSNPAPDATVIDPSVDIATTLNKKAVTAEVDVSGTEASRVALHLSRSSGFTADRSNLAVQKEIEPGQTSVTFQFEMPQTALPNNETVSDFTSYLKVGVWDALTSALGESRQHSGERAVLWAREPGEQGPRRREDAFIDEAAQEIHFILEIADQQTRLQSEPEFVVKTGGGDWPAWTDSSTAWNVSETGVAGMDTFIDREHKVSIGTKHVPSLKWRATYKDSDGNNQEIGGIISGDLAGRALVKTLSAEVDNRRNVLVWGTADDDTETVYITVTTDGTEPADPTASNADHTIDGTNDDPKNFEAVDTGVDVTLTWIATRVRVKARGENAGGQLAPASEVVSTQTVHVPDREGGLPRIPEFGPLDDDFVRDGFGGEEPGGQALGATVRDKARQADLIDAGAAAVGAGLETGGGDATLLVDRNKLSGQQIIAVDDWELYTYDPDTSVKNGVKVGAREVGSGIGSNASDFRLRKGGETLTVPGSEVDADGTTDYWVYWERGASTITIVPVSGNDLADVYDWNRIFLAGDNADLSFTSAFDDDTGDGGTGGDIGGGGQTLK